MPGLELAGVTVKHPYGVPNITTKPARRASAISIEGAGARGVVLTEDVDDRDPFRA